MNTIKLFNEILKVILKNKANLELIDTLMDKFFFSVFKLINKVSLNDS